MEANNKINRITIYIVSMTALAIIGLLASVYLYSVTETLEEQIVLRDDLINEDRIRDSITNAKEQVSKSVVEKYISDCNITIDGKQLSTSELIDYIKMQLSKNDKLETEIISLRDSLDTYKSFHELAKKNLNTDFTVKENKNEKVVTIQIPADTLKKYYVLYRLAQKDYGIHYDIERRDSLRTYRRIFSRADSGLLLLRYYRDKISRDSAGNWQVTVPRDQNR